MNKLSIILPLASSGSGLVRNTLYWYSQQTAPFESFEVILVEDGGPTPEVMALANEPWPFEVRYYISTREEKPELAHKNHARNVGWHNAAGDVVFICDCDFLVRPNFVENVFLLHAKAQTLGGRFCLYPPCAILDNEPCAERMDWSHHYDNFLSDYTCHPDAEPGLRKIEAHPEGMHIIDRRLLEILGGFDEDFLGWGGNKMELQQRINDTSIKQYLLEGCVLYHQPHGHFGDNSKAPEIKQYNQQLMAAKRNARKTDETWKRRVKFLGYDQLDPIDGVMDWIAGEVPLPPGDWRIRRKILRECEPWKPIAFIGPWIGEFGWEVCRWQGGIRKYAKQYLDDHRVIVCGDPGSQVFYSYAHEYWELPAGWYQQVLTRETHRTMPENEHNLAMAGLKGVLGRLLDSLNVPNVMFAEPTHASTRAFIGMADQEVIKLQATPAALAERDLMLARAGYEAYVCLFPRRRPINKAKNWSEDNWLKLIEWLQEKGLGVVVIGRQEDTAFIAADDTISTVNVQPDRRLEVNVAFLSDAFAAISSESGGPFLSMLCGCPTFVMGGTEWKARYEVDENFLGTECRYLEAEGYNHPLVSIVYHLTDWFNGLEEERGEGKGKKKEHQQIWDDKYAEIGSHLVGDRRQTPEVQNEDFERISRWISGYLPEHSSSVLDFGCGRGRWSPLLAGLSDYYCGVDILKPLLDEARVAHPDKPFFHVAPGSPLPFGDNSFDLVWTFTVLQHLTQSEMLFRALSEISRVLKPGGKLLAFENTLEHESRPEIAFRTIEEYRDLLDEFIGQTEPALGSLSVNGECHTLFCVSS